MSDFLLRHCDCELAKQEAIQNPWIATSPPRLRLAATRNDDLAVKDGDFVLTQDLAEQVTQALRIQLKTLRGEWFLDERVGIPYFTKILGQKPHKLTLLGIFREAILKVDGVAKITEIAVDYDHQTRTVKIDFEVELTDGQKVKLHV